MRRPRLGRIAERISALRPQQRFIASAVDLAARVVAADLAGAIGSRSSVSVPKQAGGLGNCVFRVATGAVLCDSKLDRFQQILIAERLGEELDHHHPAEVELHPGGRSEKEPRVKDHHRDGVAREGRGASDGRHGRESFE